MHQADDFLLTLVRAYEWECLGVSGITLLIELVSHLDLTHLPLCKLVLCHLRMVFVIKLLHTGVDDASRAADELRISGQVSCMLYLLFSSCVVRLRVCMLAGNDIPSCLILWSLNYLDLVTGHLQQFAFRLRKVE